MSKIAYFCIPAHGHTNPTLEVVKELVSRKNEVRYYSYDMFKEKIEATGAEYISCDAYDIQMNLKSEDAVNIGKDILLSTELLVNMTLAMDNSIINEMAQWKPDCIVADSMAIWGKLAALKLGVPFMSSTTTFAFNRYSAKIMKQSFSQFCSMMLAMPKANKLIKKLQEKGYPVKNFLSIVQNDNDTNTIVYTSPQFQPFSNTFSDKYTFVGPSIKKSNHQVIKADKKTIYISMGTVNNLNVDFYKNCIAAFRASDINVIISAGQIDLKLLGDIPPNFTIKSTVNQLEVLQQVNGFLTHCGMNSVNEALYYKVPLVLFPQTSEQGGVAYRVNELGAGIYLKDASAEKIKAAIYEILENAAYKQCAEKISNDFQKCGGFKLAADKIESLITNKG